MRIVFVRHGEPDYANDCLTEIGRKQAAAAAERLVRENITEIYSSPMGRARQTADFTAKRLGLPVTELDYMHEISWGGDGVPLEGHPWTLGDLLLEKEAFDFYHEDWREHLFFKGNSVLQYVDSIADKFDAFLAGHGYRHEKNRFFCEKGSDKTIALFSHGGSGACVLAHLLDIPFPYVCSVLPYYFTSIIILEFDNRPGSYVHARVSLFNDAAHIRGIEISGPFIQQKTDEAIQEEKGK